jgi:hypothetical protein
MNIKDNDACNITKNAFVNRVPFLLRPKDVETPAHEAALSKDIRNFP